MVHRQGRSRRKQAPRKKAPPAAVALGRLEVHALEARQILGGVAERTFRTLEAERVIAPVRRGRGGRASVYDLTVLVPAYLGHVTANRTSNDRDARARRDTATAQLNELRLKREIGELLPRQDVILRGQAFGKALRAKLRSLPRRVAQAGIVSPEHEGELAAVVRELLTEVSAWQTLADTAAVIDADAAGGDEPA